MVVKMPKLEDIDILDKKNKEESVIDNIKPYVIPPPAKDMVYPTLPTAYTTDFVVGELENDNLILIPRDAAKLPWIRIYITKQNAEKLVADLSKYL